MSRWKLLAPLLVCTFCTSPINSRAVAQASNQAPNNGGQGFFPVPDIPNDKKPPVVIATRALRASRRARGSFNCL
jgi:hypothetical protein